MATVKVSKGQCLIDIALQVYGSVEALFDLAIENGLEVDADIIPGQILQVSVVLPPTADPDIVDYYVANNIRVNSGAVVNITEILVANDGTPIVTNEGDFIGA
jgi:LysM repeat protein